MFGTMNAETGKTFTVSDGELVLQLHSLPEEEPWRYGVTSPFDPELITEANSVEEAFSMARDALQTLRESRAKYADQIRQLTAVEG